MRRQEGLTVPTFLTEAKENLAGKNILMRVDCDVDLVKLSGKWAVDEDFRLRGVLPAIHFLQERKVDRIILMGHLGRPEGRHDPDLSLAPVARWFSGQGQSCPLVNFQEALNIKDGICLLENLRFDPGEEANDPVFAKKLAGLGDIFINEAFGVSHRPHASIVGLLPLLPSFLGLKFEGEIKALSWLRKKCLRPLVFVLGGSKEDKLNYLSFLEGWADKLLVGGKLPALVKEKKMTLNKSRVILGELTSSGRDITSETVRKFVEMISIGKTVVWAGPMGIYEEEKSRQGTWDVGKAIAACRAFKVAGGGDTHRILSQLKIWDSFDYVSVGGGAMLEFLTRGSLAGMLGFRPR